MLRIKRQSTPCRWAPNAYSGDNKAKSAAIKKPAPHGLCLRTYSKWYTVFPHNRRTRRTNPGSWRMGLHTAPPTMSTPHKDQISITIQPNITTISFTHNNEHQPTTHHWQSAQAAMWNRCTTSRAGDRKWQYRSIQNKTVGRTGTRQGYYSVYTHLTTAKLHHAIPRIRRNKRYLSMHNSRSGKGNRWAGSPRTYWCHTHKSRQEWRGDRWGVIFIIVGPRWGTSLSAFQDD